MAEYVLKPSEGSRKEHCEWRFTKAKEKGRKRAPGELPRTTWCQQEGKQAHIQACRALMIISILLGFVAAMVSLLGLKCTNVGLRDEDEKLKVAVTGGFLFTLGGLCSMVAVSWYAAMITAQFSNPSYTGTKYELGDALYLGWTGSFLCMLGGIFLTCSCKGKEKQEYSANKYRYSAGQAAGQQQIYTKDAEPVTSSKECV
ncbi:claudin-15-like isoform X2 [Coturnix japonica]|uniref:claudin-15-like isoform X2 n=1 Tax=Coturnix japonica TaxID=93934 RepID=UPI000776F0E4|nr:claudin-15-like isoform X2 [Coturnix japonica]